MKVRCDFCRGKLGLMIHRYWQMRFCSSTCVQGYEQRLDETKSKIRKLDNPSSDDTAAVDALLASSATSTVAGI